jgi:hypothetical protein
MALHPARAEQLRIFASWTPEQRLAAASRMTAFGFALRDQRLRERFPGASERELGYARAREVLGLPPGLTRPA